MVIPTIVVPFLDFLRKTDGSDYIGLNPWEIRCACSTWKYMCAADREPYSFKRSWPMGGLDAALYS